MLETVEKLQPAVAKSGQTASEVAYKTAQDKFKLLQGALQAAIDKYKSTFTYRRHERKSRLSGEDHPRVVDVAELQKILDNAQYAISLKDSMLNYIDDREHFRGSKLSPLRRYIRNAIKSYIKQHHLESLELTDAILAIYLTSADNAGKVSQDEESDTQTSDEQKAESSALQNELQRTQQQLFDAQQQLRQIRDDAQAQQELAKSKTVISELQGENASLKDQIQQVRQEFDYAQQESAKSKTVISELRRENAEFKDETLRVRQEFDRIQQDFAKTKSAIAELHREKEEQAQVINKQSATIKKLQGIIHDLRDGFEKFKDVAYDTILPLKNMFANLKQYFKQAIIEKKPASTSNSNASQAESLWGAAYRKQANKELAKGGSGPVRTLYHDQIDATTGLNFNNKKLEAIDALYDILDGKFAEAAQLNDQPNRNIVRVETPSKRKESDENIRQVESLDEQPQASIAAVAIAPPPPPPPQSDAARPVKQSAVAPKSKPIEKPQPTSNANKASDSSANFAEDAVAFIKAREKRMQEGAARMTSPAQEGPKPNESPISVPEQIAARARAREERLRDSSPQVTTPEAKNPSTNSDVAGFNTSLVDGLRKRRLAIDGPPDEENDSDSDEFDDNDTSPSPTK